MNPPGFLAFFVLNAFHTFVFERMSQHESVGTQIVLCMATNFQRIKDTECAFVLCKVRIPLNATLFVTCERIHVPLKYHKINKKRALTNR